MRKNITIRRDCLPSDIIRHLERQGLGWGHDLDQGCFVLRKEVGNGAS